MLAASPFRRFVQRINHLVSRPASRRRHPRSRSVSRNIAAMIETLENRQLLSASVLVNSTSGAANYAAGVTIGQLNPSVTPVTLRDAIDAVNNTGGSATIKFDTAAFGSGQTTITLNGTPLEIADSTGNVTVQAPTSGQITISGNN